MTAEDPLAFEDVPAALARGEFSRVNSTIDRLRDYEPISDIDGGWFVYGGLARYFSCDFSGALSDYRQALADNPENVSALTNLAYVLSCCPDGELHDADSAVRFATQACEITKWKAWMQLQVLAAAHARQGDFELAREHASAAMELAPADVIWRCQRLIGKIENRQPFTGSVEEDFERMCNDNPLSK